MSGYEYNPTSIFFEPNHWHSQSSENKPLTTLFQKFPQSALQRSSKSPLRDYSSSHLRKFSRSPLYKQSKSPPRKSSRSPITKFSVQRYSRSPVLKPRCPMQRSSKSPLRRSSRSPLRRSSRSPLRRYSRSPLRRYSRSPIRRYSRSPPRRYSRTPLRRYFRSPLRRYSRSPLQRYSRSPLQKPKSPRCPMRTFSRSPLQRSSKSPLQRSSRRSLERSSRSLDQKYCKSPLIKSSKSSLKNYSRGPLKRSSRSPLQKFSRSPTSGCSRLSPLQKSFRITPKRFSISPLQQSSRSVLHTNKNHNDSTVILNNSKGQYEFLKKVNFSTDNSSNNQCAEYYSNEQPKKVNGLDGDELSEKNIQQLKISPLLTNPSTITKYPNKNLNKKNLKRKNKRPKTKDKLNAIHNLNNIFKHNVNDTFKESNKEKSCLFKNRESTTLESKTNVLSSLNNESNQSFFASFRNTLESNCNKTQLSNYADVQVNLRSSVSIQNSLNNDTKIENDQQSIMYQIVEHYQNSVSGSPIVISEINKPAQSNEVTSSLMSCELKNEICDGIGSLEKCKAKKQDTNSFGSSSIENLNSDMRNNGAYRNTDNNILDKNQLMNMNPALMEFDILDDLEKSENECDDTGMDKKKPSDYEKDNNQIPVKDFETILDEGLLENFTDKKTQPMSNLGDKYVLEENGCDHFDLLPEEWVKIMHSSGMPVYLHQKSRVCTMTRPYNLGPGSARNHKIPLSAVPCLQYKKALEVEKKKEQEKEKNMNQSQYHPEQKLISAHIETFEENKAAQFLESAEVHDYCKKVFSFKKLSLISFKSWANRRKYFKSIRDLQQRQRPALLGRTKLIKVPVQNADGGNSKSEWIINPNYKSYVCILHEYVQNALKKHLEYRFCELENPATPYSATVFIEDLQYCVGVGASKKQAKVEAAKAALELLIPEMKDKIERDSQCGMRSGITKKSEDNNGDISIFDQISIVDPRVAENFTKSTQPSPYAILLTCLSRNLRLGELKVHYEMKTKIHKKDKFTMSVNNHKVTVDCSNKREGKQKAAQALLQALHPNITSWGSLLRMYSNQSIKRVKEKKQEEQKITSLQSTASQDQPNYALLEKLRTEMLKLEEKRQTITAKGKFTLPKNAVSIPFHPLI